MKKLTVKRKVTSEQIKSEQTESAKQIQTESAKLKPYQTAFGRYASMMPIAENAATVKWAMDNYPMGRTNIFGIVIHHTDGNSIDSARKVLAAKKESTNIIIDEHGGAYIEMPLYKTAAACVGYNKWMIQTDVVGRLSINPPTEAQLKSLCNVVKLLACGRKIVAVDPQLAAKTRKANKSESAKLTEAAYSKDYTKARAIAEKEGCWKNALPELPFIVTWHGEVRPTECCGTKFIPILKKLIENGFNYGGLQ